MVQGSGLRVKARGSWFRVHGVMFRVEALSPKHTPNPKTQNPKPQTLKGSGFF